MAKRPNTYNGGDVISRALKARGVETTFCLAGTAHTHLLAAMDRDGLATISTRHEAATVLMADGYARVSGQVGVALIKADQGIANAMTGMCTAQDACSPVVVIASLSPLGGAEARSEGTNDGLDMVKPFVKWAKSVPRVERLREYVDMAIKAATSGRPGVAVLGIQHEFEGMAVEAAEAQGKFPLTDVARPAPDQTSIDAAADLLAKAKKPLILAGTGAAIAGAGPALRKLSKAFNMPVLANALGRGLVPEDLVHGFSWPLAQPAAKDADVVLALGIRFTQRMGYGLPPRFSAKAKVIQVDVAEEEIGRNRAINVPVVGDAKLAVEALHKALKKRKASWAKPPAWVNRAIKERTKRIAEVGTNKTGKIHPYHIGRSLMARLPKEFIYVGDGADIQNWMHGVLQIRSDRAFMDHYPFGSMGVGTPLAVGAAAAERDMAKAEKRKERPTILVTGDGAFGFYPSEFNGAEMAGLKIACVISNDGAWGTEKHGQAKALGTSYNCELGHCDYELMAKAFGADGERVEDAADIDAAIGRALAADGCYVVNAVTDPEAGMLRKTDPRVQTVAFEDLASSLKTFYTPDVA